MHVPVAVLQSSRRLSHEPKRTSELHAAPVAAAGWQVPAPVARSRSQNSGDAHWRIVVHADPATFDGTTHVGVGEARTFERHNDGIDVDVDDRPNARPTRTRLVVDADVGVGSLRIGHSAVDPLGNVAFDYGDVDLELGRNTACVT